MYATTGAQSCRCVGNVRACRSTCPPPHASAFTVGSTFISVPLSWQYTSKPHTPRKRDGVCPRVCMCACIDLLRRQSTHPTPHQRTNCINVHVCICVNINTSVRRALRAASTNAWAFCAHAACIHQHMHVHTIARMRMHLSTHTNTNKRAFHSFAHCMHALPNQV